MRAAVCALLVSLTMIGPAPASAQILDFESLDGWENDDHRAALQAFRQTCDLLDAPDWRPVCRLAQDAGNSDAQAKAFELVFKPVLIGAPPALFTGYYEPELDGSPVRTPRFAWPLYRRPPELQDGTPYLSRQAIEAGALRGRGLELVWLDDPVEAFFLQVQGSGRVRLPDGRVMRVGYAGKNGFPYRSVGQEMIRRGTHTADQVSAESIRSHVQTTGSAGMDLLNVNPSYVFFRQIGDLAADKGPIGAMGRSITTMRSIAVDPAFTPLGAPVWVEKAGSAPIRRLMIAQDTGGAIKGAQRADIFFGTGQSAGLAAGNIKDGGRMIVLVPVDRAFAMVSGG